MNFTHRAIGVAIASGILTIAVAGWIPRGGPAVPASAQYTAPQYALSAQRSDPVRAIPAVDVAPAPGMRSAYYQPVTSWYKSERWWKRNAPIVGGAGGGALIGGLVGGGKGALIGGAAGGGGGYLYKRYRHHHRRPHQPEGRNNATTRGR